MSLWLVPVYPGTEFTLTYLQRQQHQQSDLKGDR